MEINTKTSCNYALHESKNQIAAFLPNKALSRFETLKQCF